MSRVINSSTDNTTWLSGVSGGTGYTYTTTGTNYAWNPAPNNVNIESTLQVQGDSEFVGDVTVKGRSLTEVMESVERRLRILRPNPALEAEWDQLRELGDQYRELEQQLTEKAQMWQTLKK